jgi:hypothetical protein
VKLLQHADHISFVLEGPNNAVLHRIRALKHSPATASRGSTR